MIKIGVKGKVLTGEYPNWFVLVEPSPELWNGVTQYYLFIGKNDPKQGYDTWYATYGDLVEAVEDLGEIEWLES